MSGNDDVGDPSTWDPALDAVVAAPKHHRVLFENENMRVIEVTLEPDDEEPVHHHRWPSVFVFDAISGPIHDIAPDGSMLPPNRDVVQAVEAWDGKGCLVVNMAPQPAGRVLNASKQTAHGIRIEMKKDASAARL
ncbi:MAG: hypothetical protein ABIQ30_11730 [Devosia sp.]